MKKLNLVCSTDSLRPVLNYVQYLNGYFIATDCHTLIKSPKAENFDIEGMPDEFYINYKVWAEMVKINPYHFEITGNLIKCVGKKGEYFAPFMTVETFIDKVGKYFDTSAVLGDTLMELSEVIPAPHIGINTKLIKQLSDAMGAEILCYFIRANDKPIKVVSIDADNKTIGLIMPIYIPDADNFRNKFIESLK
jgi:hypothetical protein